MIQETKNKIKRAFRKIKDDVILVSWSFLLLTSVSITGCENNKNNNNDSSPQNNLKWELVATGYYRQTKLELYGDDFKNKIGIARVDEIIDMQARFTLVVKNSFHELGPGIYNLGPFNASFEKKLNHVYLKPFEVSNDSLSIRSTTLKNEPIDTVLSKRPNGQLSIVSELNFVIR